MVQDVTMKPDRLLPAEHTTPQGPPAPPSQRDAIGPKPQAPASVRVDDPHLGEAVKRLSEALQQANVELQMDVDPDLHRVIVKIVDGQSGQLIRQIPAEDAVNLAKDLQSWNGLLVEKHA